MSPLSIFYDLETSDQNTVGQILNYAFIAIDQDWQVVGTCSGDVRISRLQLPRAGAILANRVNVLEHQKNTATTELEAMIEIQEFINEMIACSGQSVTLIGYNSDRFDLRYLRTSFIRNGVNPYFNRKLLPRDLLIVSRKLAVSNPDFPRLASAQDPEKLSLRLETLTQYFGLLEGEQTHTSLDDVRITIDLARLYHEKYNIDVRIYEGYEISSDPEPGTIVSRKTPAYDLQNPSRYEERLYMFLTADYRAALWVDIEAYKNGAAKSSIRHRRKACGEFFYEHTACDEATKVMVRKAFEEFKHITLKNFFEQTNCDVEQDIYQVDFAEMDALHDAIHKNDESRIKNLKRQQAKSLLVRHKLAHYVPDGSESDRDLPFWNLFKQYILYRYGGKMSLSLYDTEEIDFHPTAQELLAEIETARIGAQSDDNKLLEALELFYQQSEIFQIAGAELGVA